MMYQVFKAKMDIKFSDRQQEIPSAPMKSASSDGKNFEVIVKSKDIGQTFAAEVTILSERKRLMADFEHYLNLINTVLGDNVGHVFSLNDIRDVSCVILGDLEMVKDDNRLQLKKDHHNHFYIINPIALMPIMNSFDDENIAMAEYFKYLKNYPLSV